jgi:hypothetical protein
VAALGQFWAGLWRGKPSLHVKERDLVVKLLAALVSLFVVGFPGRLSRAATALPALWLFSC